MCGSNVYRGGWAGGASDKSEGITGTELGVMDFPPGYQTVMGHAELAKGTCSGRHTHPGIETAYILEGEGTVIDGQPDQHLKAGDPIRIPRTFVARRPFSCL